MIPHRRCRIPCYLFENEARVGIMLVVTAGNFGSVELVFEQANLSKQHRRSVVQPVEWGKTVAWWPDQAD